MNSSLVSFHTRVESPFVIIRIGDYTFGHCQGPLDRKKLTSFKVTYPNYMNGVTIKKINGAINTYSIRMTYAITENDDPNMLEKVFSSISNSRKITISYGDWALPNYIYKEEVALLTEVNSQVDFANSKIEYTLKATSNALAGTAILHDFPALFKKPSEEIKRILKDNTFGLTDVFYGMRDLDDSKLNSLIIGDDKEVELKAQHCSALNYINYLVSCMTYQEDRNTDNLKSARYYWSTYDDINNEYGGPYFKVVKVQANAKYNLSYDCYEVDVGYPNANFVSNFTLNSNESWALLYNYSKEIASPSYSYDIDSRGQISTTYSPAIFKSNKYGSASETTRAWWSNMTQYPISAKITVKGLLKPALLMSYLKVNTYFYGRKHISSGLYIITMQEDQIDSSGYKTTLSITRISGDEMG